MSQDVNSAVYVVTTQVTLLGSGLTWCAANTNLLTFFVFAITGVASIVYGSRNSKANQERNRINRRDITQDILDELVAKGGSSEQVEEIIRLIRK